MTKKLSLLAIVAMISCSAVAQGIEFVELSWQDALAKAKEENKLLFVDAYAQWCGPCKKMAKYEFTQESVGDYYNQNFVNLKLDMETPNGRTFDAAYPVSAYPTMFFLDGDGKVVRKIKGGQKADQLVSMAKGVVNSYDYSADYKVKYDEGDRSYETVYNYVKTLNQSGKPSLAISNQYLRSEPELTDDQRLAFIAESATESDSKIYDQLLEQKKAAITLLGEDKYNKIITRACDNTVAKAVDFEMEELLDIAITNAEKGLTDGAKLYELSAKKTYGLEMKNIGMYLSSAQGLGKAYLKSGDPAMAALLKELSGSKVSSAKIEKLGLDLSEKYHKKQKSAASATLYAEALVKNDKPLKAIKVLEKTTEDLDSKGTDSKSLQRLIKILKSKHT